MQYTNKEIQKSINILKDRMDLKKKERTKLTQEINSIKKQIQAWNELDTSQLKAF